MNKRLLYSILIVSGFIFCGLFVFNSHVSAQTYYYEDVNVDVTLNPDSSFKVVETYKLNFSGEFHRVFRSITLNNEYNQNLCRANTTLQCGGFEYINIDKVTGEGRELKSDEYEISKVYESNEDRLKILWEFAPDGKTFSNNEFVWSVEYTVYGGIGYFDDYDLFYWNALFPDRDVDIVNAKVSIHFPDAVTLGESDQKVLGALAKFSQPDSKTAEFTTSNSLQPGEDYTILIKIPKGQIQKYSTVKFSGNPEVLDVLIDNKILLEDKSNEIKGLPAGKHTIKFKKSGYYDHEVDLTLASGETKSIGEITLKKTPLQQLIEIVIILCNLAACPIFIFVIGFAYYQYRSKGRDAQLNKTVVPWFNPPDDIPPALLGSVVDEKVDMKDISSTIINLAYNGYIKIKELDKKDYELIKLKPFDDLDSVQKKIIEDIMDSSESKNISSLKNSFYKKITGIKDKIYQEMVNRKYFQKRPDQVRTQYIGIAIGIVIFGFVLSFILPAIGVFLLGPALAIAGIISIPFAYGMPAKTALGSEILNKIKGFQMYLRTAERFRLQNLTPDTFEKFLSYAVVFGIEKQWAEKFKDIYKTPPDWYEGRNMSTFNTLYLANALGSMQTNVSSTLSSTPSSSGSGWSGGGGFSGGFSGGGGGGGGGGAS